MLRAPAPWLLVALLSTLAAPSLGSDAHAAGVKPVHGAKPAHGKKRPAVSSETTPAPPPGSVTPEAERLGRGVHALWAGDLAGARRELTPLVEKKGKDGGPRVRNLDYAIYDLAQAELLAGDAAPALARFEEIARGKSRFQAVAVAREADAALALGRRELAKKLYETALAHPSADVDAAVCRFRLAQLAEPGEGAATHALALYRKLYVEHPLHPLAAVALARMTELDASTVITPQERIARAKTMTANRGWSLAIEELEKLPADLPQPLRDEADYWYGTTLFHMRRNYDVAATKLLGVWSRLPGEDRKSEALFHGARAQSRADHDDEAIAGYRDVVARYPHCKNAAEASFLSGWLEFNRGRYKDAIPALQDTLQRYGSSQFGDDARWYLGFSRWLDGDVEHALADFNRLAAGHGDLSAGKGRYFAALALAKLGRNKESDQALASLAKERPFTYYALLARLRLGERMPLDVFGRDKKGDAVASDADAATETTPTASADANPAVETSARSASLDAAVLKDLVVQRADELLAATLPVEASFELQRAEGELLRHYTAERALPVLFDRYTRGQDFYRIHRLAEGHAGRALGEDPHASATAKTWWELVYPRAYRAFVEKYSPSGEDPPYYLYTIMQKESAYNPHDVSYADAIGLLQMIPPTSRRVAAHVDAPYTDDVLYDPEGNIRFGAWYIGNLLQKFKGQIAIGAGSYNAGPKAMMKWLDKNGARPLDEFIELCPYTQTREYMKKALAIYARYLYLYDKKDYLPSLVVDADYMKNDLDY